MGFEQYYGQRGKSGSPKASIWKGGQINLNNALLEKFDMSPSGSVQLFFDREKKRIGFRLVADKNEAGAMKLTKRSGGALIFARGYLNYFEIEYNKAKRFDVRFDEKEDLYILEPEK